jgi:RimJ/RimL family protein N-acetyltransferase
MSSVIIPKMSASPDETFILLRDVTDTDLRIFFDHQLDPDANHMAAFTAGDPADRAAFDRHWTRIRADATITIKTILVDNEVAGHVAKFQRDREPEITYWLGKPYWGKGIATAALREFLKHIEPRPIYARAAKDNLASRRVLEKCGFKVCGQDKGFAQARGQEIEEFILRLE